MCLTRRGAKISCVLGSTFCNTYQATMRFGQMIDLVCSFHFTSHLTDQSPKCFGSDGVKLSKSIHVRKECTLFKKSKHQSYHMTSMIMSSRTWSGRTRRSLYPRAHQVPTSPTKISFISHIFKTNHFLKGGCFQSHCRGHGGVLDWGARYCGVLDWRTRYCGVLGWGTRHSAIAGDVAFPLLGRVGEVFVKSLDRCVYLGHKILDF